MNGRRRLARRWATACVVASFLASSGCVIPPAVQPAGALQISLANFPPGTEPVEISLATGERLRGVFVPADPNAPVVLHFLETEASITVGTVGPRRYPVLRDLRDIGLASLVFDYRGVGGSEGDRSPRNLREDALAAWREAVRRAGGDPHRVVVRGISLGTLAAAFLMKEGVEPAATVLVAPVRAETAAKHFLYEAYPAVLAWPVALFLRDLTDVDIIEAIRSNHAPLLVAEAKDDFFLDATERARLDAAVREVGGDFIVATADGHIGMAAEAHGLLRAEIAFYRAVFPGWPPTDDRVDCVLESLAPKDAARFAADATLRERLERLVERFRIEPPTIAAALALTHQSIDIERLEVLVDWIRRTHIYRFEPRDLPFDVLQAWVDLRDPCVDIEPAEVLPADVEVMRTLTLEIVEKRLDDLPESLIRHAWLEELDRQIVYIGSLIDAVEVWDEFRIIVRLGGGLPADAMPLLGRIRPRDGLRRIVRVLLKNAGIPDRVVQTAPGDYRIEVWTGSGWRSLGMPDPSE
ncbi:MAG: hypothetical protein HY292_05085 [Planctomycetes bacterium]|nr:hypothetical protein [Planctomycetota bacterium]